MVLFVGGVFGERLMQCANGVWLKWHEGCNFGMARMGSYLRFGDSGSGIRRSSRNLQVAGMEPDEKEMPLVQPR